MSHRCCLPWSVWLGSQSFTGSFMLCLKTNLKFLQSTLCKFWCLISFQQKDRFFKKNNNTFLDLPWPSGGPCIGIQDTQRAVVYIRIILPSKIYLFANRSCGGEEQVPGCVPLDWHHCSVLISLTQIKVFRVLRNKTAGISVSREWKKVGRTRKERN